MGVGVKLTVGCVRHWTGGGVVLCVIGISCCLDLVLCLWWVVCETCASALWDSDCRDVESDLLVSVVVVDGSSAVIIMIVWNIII